MQQMAPKELWRPILNMHMLSSYLLIRDTEEWEGPRRPRKKDAVEEADTGDGRDDAYR